MPALILDPKALESYLPHRGINLMPDEVVLSEDRLTSQSRTRIPRDDPRGRTFFGRCDRDQRLCWYEPFLGELMALTGVPLLADDLNPKGQMAVFSAVTRLDFGPLVPMDEELVGYTQITRKRSDFTAFKAWMTCRGQRIFETEILSGAATMADISRFPVRPLEGRTVRPVDPSAYAWKGTHLRFLDGLVSADPATRRLVGTYTYPDNHPLVPGHFPGSPLMMGVTQWAAVADAGWEAARCFGLPGPLCVNGRIIRADGNEVLTVRDMVLAIEDGMPRLVSTKRVTFREPVRPGDGVLVEVELASP